MSNVVDLRNKYNANAKKYNDLKDKYTKEKDEQMNAKLRPLAQDSLGFLMELKDYYQSQMSENDENKKKYADDLQTTEKLIDVWLDRLTKLGSSISGIPNTTFDDIAGLEDVKQTAKNYLFALKNPKIAEKYNISTNVGILLYGPPGTGKTLVAKAIAHELGVRFFVITPSMIFGSYVGESERNVREIFTELRACKNGAVLLVDECESIFARREGNSSRAEIGVANQLLQEMNGATDSEGGDKRVIIGATNRPWLMDEAYLRYKRFSLHFYIDMPNRDAIKTVVRLNLKKLPCDAQLEEMITSFFQNREGEYTCADISGIIEQCAYLAMQEYQRKVEQGYSFKKDEVVNINTSHFNQVMKTFSKSVKREDLRAYEEFRDSRNQVK
ncbi:MAG: ATP-binding protein [Clostridia bacterium]|nr:ATP-binding protein [Clostridia bacterium]